MRESSIFFLYGIIMPLFRSRSFSFINQIIIEKVHGGSTQLNEIIAAWHRNATTDSVSCFYHMTSVCVCFGIEPCIIAVLAVLLDKKERKIV